MTPIKLQQTKTNSYKTYLYTLSESQLTSLSSITSRFSRPGTNICMARKTPTLWTYKMPQSLSTISYHFEQTKRHTPSKRTEKPKIPTIQIYARHQQIDSSILRLYSHFFWLSDDKKQEPKQPDADMDTHTKHNNPSNNVQFVLVTNTHEKSVKSFTFLNPLF
jgi:hypothetical protein